jgi:uncharacterized RDD family membrane protein YckC
MDPNQPQPGGPAAGWQRPVEPAGPAPGVAFAGHGARLVAYLVDGLILTIALFVLVAVPAMVGFVAFARNDGPGMGAIAVAVVLSLVAIVVSIAYFPFFWARSGQTPGMKLFRLRVVRDRDGGPISGGQAVMRLVGYWINSVALYIGFAWILVDQRRRGWHDLIAGTVVIEDPR